jgi:hypothetical protein
LGILDLELQNKFTLAKWIVNLLNTDGMWQDLLKNKYLKTKSLTQVKTKPYDSHFWRGIVRIKGEVLTNGSFIIRDGSTTHFLEDKWCVGNVSLRERYPSIFNIVRDRHSSVAKILATHPLNTSF